MTEHHTLSDRLRARANQLGISPAHVAEMAGVNRSFVYDILRGRSARPGIDRLAEVARVLKVDRDWLIHGIGEVEVAVNVADPTVAQSCRENGRKASTCDVEPA